MMQVIPRWKIEWKYRDIKEPVIMYVNAQNNTELFNWFVKINHGLLQIECITSSLADENQFNQVKER